MSFCPGNLYVVNDSRTVRSHHHARILFFGSSLLHLRVLKNVYTYPRIHISNPIIKPLAVGKKPYRPITQAETIILFHPRPFQMEFPSTSKKLPLHEALSSTLCPSIHKGDGYACMQPFPFYSPSLNPLRSSFSYISFFIFLDLAFVSQHLSLSLVPPRILEITSDRFLRRSPKLGGKGFF